MKRTEKAIRVLVADDHRLFREGVVGLLAADPRFEVVADVGDGREALRLAGELLPDVCLLDVAMPEMNGIEAARRLARDCPSVKTLALSMHGESRFVAEMFQAGVSGYVLKMCDFDELADALLTVAGGGSHVSRQVAGDVIKNLAGMVPARAGGLSEREREVLQLLAEGKTSKESAAALHVSVKTVDTHRRQIMQKLGLGSVAELTKYAIRAGLTSL